MRIDWWTLALQTVNVLVLIWGLSRFLFRPVAKIIAERQAAAIRLLDEAAAKGAAAERDRAAAEAALAEARAVREAALGTVEAEAEREKSALIAAARREAEAQRGVAEAEAARLRDDALRQAGDQAAELAVDIADRLMDRLPETARIDGFISGLAKALETLPESSKQAMGSKVTLIAARPMSEEESRRCRAAMAEALGRPIEIAVAVDGSLIAGLEIKTPEAEITNHFRADLDRIRKGLATHGAA